MKYEVKMSCGHTETVNLFGKDADRKRRIEYLENYGLCTECYKKQKAEEDREKGFLFKACYNSMINGRTGEIEMTVWFEGDTKPHKDEIKGLGGFRWGQKDFPKDPWKDDFFCWSKIIKEDQLENEVEKARSIGAEVVLPKERTKEFASSQAAHETALSSHKYWLEKQQKKKDLKVQMVPPVPDVIAGKRWNGTVYGKEGNRSIYIDNKQIKVDDALAAELEEYNQKYDEYLKKTDEIEREYSSRISQYGMH